MKKAKKVLAVWMAVVVLVVGATLSLSSGATENNEISAVESNVKASFSNGSIVGGAIDMTPQEYEDYLQSLSDDELQIIAEKNAEAEALAVEWEQQQSTTRASSMIYVPGNGNFTLYIQSTSYYCVPATARTIEQYINGSSSTQATIAAAMGTTVNGTSSTQLAIYLRSKQNKCYYIYSAFDTNESMASRIYHDVVAMGVSSSIGISTTINTWHYSSSGHSLVCYGIQSDKTQIRIADPVSGYGGNNYPAFYTLTTTYVGRVCTRIVW